MINSWEIIKELESNNSRLFKEDIIEKPKLLEFEEGLAMLRPISYFCKQVPESENGTGSIGQILKILQFAN